MFFDGTANNILPYTKYGDTVPYFLPVQLPAKCVGVIRRFFSELENCRPAFATTRHRASWTRDLEEQGVEVGILSPAQKSKQSPDG